MGWALNFANVVRGTLFQDDTLKTLMAIPTADKSNLITFRDKYFVKGPTVDTLIVDEPVRVLYSEERPTETSAPNIFEHMVMFEIYVRNDVRYNATDDRMMERAELIAQRLYQLLHRKRVSNIMFWSNGVFDQTCRIEGYTRKVAIFSYKRIY